MLRAGCRQVGSRPRENARRDAGRPTGTPTEMPQRAEGRDEPGDATGPSVATGRGVSTGGGVAAGAPQRAESSGAIEVQERQLGPARCALALRLFQLGEAHG